MPMEIEKLKRRNQALLEKITSLERRLLRSQEETELKDAQLRQAAHNLELKNRALDAEQITAENLRNDLAKLRTEKEELERRAQSIKATLVEERKTNQVRGRDCHRDGLTGVGI